MKKSRLTLGLNPGFSRDWWMSNPLSHNGKLNRGMLFLALNKKWQDEAAKQILRIQCFKTAKLLSFQRKPRMRRNKGTRREAIKWEDYRRIHYIAAWWFHSFPRDCEIWHDETVGFSSNFNYFIYRFWSQWTSSSGCVTIWSLLILFEKKNYLCSSDIRGSFVKAANHDDL